jgi:prevent-host-death family protein
MMRSGTTNGVPSLISSEWGCRGRPSRSGRVGSTLDASARGLEKLFRSSYSSSVTRASITDAKNRLSALLDRVRHGESVLIVDRGVPIALVSPVTGPGAGADRARLARLERQGVLRPPQAPKRRGALAPPLRPARHVALSDLVRRERSEGW